MSGEVRFVQICPIQCYTMLFYYFTRSVQSFNPLGYISLDLKSCALLHFTNMKSCTLLHFIDMKS